MGRRSTLCKYRTLGLFRVQIDRKETSKVIRLLEYNSESLQSFILDSCSGYCDVILTAVLTGTQATNLQIVGECSGLYALGMGLGQTQHLTELELTGIWEWNENFGQALAKGLEYATTLIVLAIKDCTLDDDTNTLPLLADGLKANRSLRDLKIVDSHLSDKCGPCVFDSLLDNSSLSSVSVHGNYLGSLTVASIANWIRSEYCGLESLCLSSQHKHLQGNLSPLADALATNTSLHTLELSGNELQDQDVSHLWKALRSKTTNLQDIFLQYNDLSDEAVFDFCKHLPHMSSLRLIKMYGHPFTLMASKWLLRALECGNTSLGMAALGACSTQETQNRVRHYFHLNRAGRSICRDDKCPPGLLPHLLARANVLWDDDDCTKTRSNVLFGLLQELQPRLVSVVTRGGGGGGG